MKYTPDLKKMLVRSVIERRATPSELSKILGVDRRTIIRWVERSLAL